MKWTILPTGICLFIAATAVGMTQKPPANNVDLKNAMLSCGPPQERFKVHLDPEATRSSPTNPDKARFYFYAPKSQSLVLHDPTVRIAMDGMWIGALMQNSYTELEVTPGQHHLCIRAPGYFQFEPASLYELDAKAGHSYYFIVADISPEYQPDMIRLNRIDSDEGRLLVGQAMRATSTPKPGRHHN